MTDTAEIRRRPDGSIDTAHYLARGRSCRAEAARDIAGGVATSARGPILGLAALATLLPFLTRQG